MASTYSTNLRLELIGTGEQQGSWGATTNKNLGTLLEQAICGYESVTVSNTVDTVLTATDGTVDQSRNMILNFVGTITAARNVICPAIEKLYVVRNATTGGFPITFKVSGQTGVSVPNGATVFLYVDGTDVRTITASAASRDIGTSGATVPLLNGTNTWSGSQTFSNTNYFNAPQVIETSNTFPALRITQTGAGNALIVEDSANPDATPFVVDNAGNVGIGASLTVNSGVNVGVTTDYGAIVTEFGSVELWRSSGDPFIDFKTSVSEDFDTRIIQNSNGLAFWTGGNTTAAERVRFAANGKVGINTSSPVADLHIVGTDNNSNILAAGASKALRVTPTSTHVQIEGTDNTGVGSYQPLVIGGSIVQLATGGSERVRIDASGNVGIGTASPAVPLDIASAGIRINTSRAISANVDNGVLTLFGGTSGNGANIELCGSSYSLPSAALIDADGHFFRSANAASEYLRINTSGALGFSGANFGTAGQYLRSSGSGGAPSWTSLGSMSLQNSSSVSITGGSISGITDLAIADGGTGASTAAAARTNLGLGTIATQNSNAVSITGGSISGITDLAVADGGTGASDAATARTNLGLTIGTNVQAYDATLQSISALGTAADRYAYTTGVDTWAEGTITAAGRAILDDADAAAQRTTLGLGTGATLNAGTSANNLVQLDGSARLPAVDGSQLTNLQASGRLLRAPQILTSGTIYTTPSGCNSIYVELVGGGGGGGGADSNVGGNAQGGAGGGAGGYCAAHTPVSPSTNYNYTIGLGGTAGNSSGGNGTSGGNTTITIAGTTFTANGGGGGSGITFLNPTGVGGSGGTASGGQLNVTGGGGGGGNTDGNATPICSGTGGSSFFGGGGAGVNGDSSGFDGSSGGGGSGGANNDDTTGSPGGAGGTGLIRIWEYS